MEPSGAIHPKNHARYTRHNSPPAAVVATVTGAAPSQGDHRAVPPAWWPARAAIRSRSPATSLSTAGVFVFARPAPPSILAGPSLGAFGPHLAAAIQARQSERPCLFASGEASDSERLRLPPQIRPQPTHPVCQNIVWHPEVNGDVAVVPAVYNPALQQRAVVCAQIPEEVAKSVTSHGLHWGDLGRHHDQHLGRPPNRRSPGRCGPLVLLVLLFPSSLVRPSKYLEPYPRPRERLGNTKTGRLLGHGDVFQGDGDSSESCP